MISSDPQLDQLVATLSQQTIIALDTEFMWRNTYFPKLCLIQIATVERSYLIDPLAPINLKKLKPILEDPKILKLFHAASHDIKILATEIGAKTSPVADTQMAAEFLGLIHQGSLQWILEHYTLASLSKKQKLSNWGKRPLTPSQLHYAEDDVTFLIPCYLKLKAALEATSRFEWFKEESKTLTQKKCYLYTDPDKAYLRISAHRKLKLPALQILKALTKWREQRAIKQNVILKNVLSDQSIIQLSMNPPEHQSELMLSNYALTSKQQLKSAREIFTLLEKNKRLQTPVPIDTSVRPRINKEMLNMLHDKLQSQSKKLNIIPQLIASRSDLKAYLQNDHSQLTKFTCGWRSEIMLTLIQENQT
jgi:ribonuclease D